ncbi:hypothetical protein [Wenxinia marina]|uniref:DUF4386 domain-containing protein n=1 Tax=Wenxinia marina DSM 24838 TaxID=1123501 RepID=A0A0D0PIM8_9RHOB|nr:hypothetical protein [Wenxinia marina]KIQ71191.1 hypothetical protein Wenmar_00570 [Wenxinia marina DSM 24838]GGL81760.1 hypothetical protein GCM10011392_40470 [Wenxinia marina]
MTLHRIGGLAALICGVTYLVGFALLVTILAPLGFGSGSVDPRAVVDFNDARPGILTAWNSTIYVVNALALAVLVVALSRLQASATPARAAVTHGLGLIWAALGLGAGMMANVALEQAALAYAADPGAAADLWATLHVVELGLGGGNEIAGGVWIAGVSAAAWAGRTLPQAVAVLGLLTGLGGLATIVPALGETAGAVFGLGAIAWFLAVGVVLLAVRDRAASPLPSA